jgi:hypothetical protein
MKKLFAIVARLVVVLFASVAGLVVLLLAIATVRDLLQDGVTVNVKNVGNEPMIAVVVHVSSNSYPVGNIVPGEMKSVVVKPHGETDVRLEQQGHDPLVVDIYLESGYTGSVTAEITPTLVVNVRHDIQVGSF